MAQKIKVDLEELNRLTKLHVPIKQIAAQFGVLLRTIKRRKQEIKLKSFSNISQNDLEVEVISMKNVANKANWGLKMTQGYLTHKGIEVGKDRVYVAFKTVDSEGLQERKQKTIKRRQYFNPTGNLVR